MDRTPEDISRVFFGAWVELQDTEGNIHHYRVVALGESDYLTGFISIDSPMARALLRRAEGEEVEVCRPSGTDAFVSPVNPLCSVVESMSAILLNSADIGGED